MEYIRSALTFIISILIGMKNYLHGLQDRFWNRLAVEFYSKLPTEQGELDEELKEYIREGLLFIGVRFKAFNRSVGTLTAIGIFSTLLLFGTSAIYALSIGFLPQPIFEVSSLLILLVFGILLTISVVAVVLSNTILVLYFGSLLRFSFQQARSNLIKKDSSLVESDGKGDDEIYECENDKEMFNVYARNFSAFINSVIYSMVIVVIILCLKIAPWLLQLISWLANLIPIAKLNQTPVLTLSGNLVESISTLLRIEIEYFFSQEGLQSLSVIAICLLLFSIFLNFKYILQHAERSQIDWSEIGEYSAMDELKQSYTILKISLYYLIDGEFESESREIRADIVESGAFLVFTVILSIFYLYMALEMI